MKLRLLDLLICPVCAAGLTCHAFERQSEPVASAPATPACAGRCARHDAAVATLAAPPDCRACYGDDIVSGVLGCTGCGRLYPILAGVPRLIRDAVAAYPDFFNQHHETLAGLAAPMAGIAPPPPLPTDRRSNDSFSLQWQNHGDQDKTWFKDDLALRRDEFAQSLDVEPAALAGRLVLDAGCGNGRLTAAVAGYGAEIVGMDLSGSVERAQANRPRAAGERAPFVHFIQGNVLEPPLAREAFDFVHSSGVIHHTPDPEGALRALLPRARRRGKLYIQLYRKREAWVGLPNQLLRLITTRLPVRLLYRLCWLAVPLHTALVMVVARLRGETSPLATASHGERALSLFDNFSPRYQFRYTAEQVARLFRAAGLDDVRDVTLANEARHMVAFVGTRGDGDQGPVARA